MVMIAVQVPSVVMPNANVCAVTRACCQFLVPLVLQARPGCQAPPDPSQGPLAKQAPQALQGPLEALD